MVEIAYESLRHDASRRLDCTSAGMTAADMAELCTRLCEPGVTKTLRCVRMGPPIDNGGNLPDDVIRSGLVQLLTGPRRLEVRIQYLSFMCTQAAHRPVVSSKEFRQMNKAWSPLSPLCQIPDLVCHVAALLSLTVRIAKTSDKAGTVVMAGVQTLYLWGANAAQRDVLVAAQELQADGCAGYGYCREGDLAGSLRISSIAGYALTTAHGDALPIMTFAVPTTYVTWTSLQISALNSQVPTWQTVIF